MSKGSDTILAISWQLIQWCKLPLPICSSSTLLATLQGVGQKTLLASGPHHWTPCTRLIFAQFNEIVPIFWNSMHIN